MFKCLKVLFILLITLWDDLAVGVKLTLTSIPRCWLQTKVSLGTRDSKPKMNGRQGDKQTGLNLYEWSKEMSLETCVFVPLSSVLLLFRITCNLNELNCFINLISVLLLTLKKKKTVSRSQYFAKHICCFREKTSTSQRTTPATS